MRKQIPLVQEFISYGLPTDWNVGSDYGAFHKNLYISKNTSAVDNSQKFYIKQRPAIVGSPLGGVTPAANAQIVAFSTDETNSNSYFRVYSDGTLAGTSCYLVNVAKALPGTWSSATKHYHLIQLTGTSSGLYGGYAWFMSTPTEGAVVATDGTITEVTDADYTAWGNKTNPVAMDGFVFQGNSATCKIYHSDQNAPTSWAATSVIDANLVPGQLMSLQRVRNYLIAFKTRSIEFFKNGGNPTPGSTLDSIPEMMLRYGCQGGRLITRTQDAIVWIGRDEMNNSGVFKMNTNNFEVTRISNEAIDAWVDNSYGQTQISDANGSSFLISGFLGGWRAEVGSIPYLGREFILFPVLATASVIFTLVFDNETGLWYYWSSTYSGSEISFPYASFKQGTIVYVYNGFMGKHPRSISDNTALGDFAFDDSGNGQTSANISIKWVSNPMDFGSLKRKFQSYLEIGYDLALGTSNSGTIGMYYYDDDGTTPCTTRTITTTASGLARAVFRRLGSFRTRRYVITHTGKERIKFTIIEADINSSDDSTD